MNSYRILGIPWILRILRILQSSIDSNYYCVYSGDFRPTAKLELSLHFSLKPLNGLV
jgi:hypothetical protein